MKLKNITVQPTALLAELLGTFILVTVAVTVANPIIVGFTLLVLVLAIGAVSGAHVNPAVTFALWSARKLDGMKVPFYWAMQFTGAILALLLTQWYQNISFGISFTSMASLDAKILVAELLGAAVFAFAVTAAVHKDLKESAKALCIGLGLLTGLAVGGGLLGAASQAALSDQASRVNKVDGVTLNPAVALAATEKVQQTSLSAMAGQEASAQDERASSRLTWEVIVGTLVGGALGANLYLVTAGENILKKKRSLTAKVTTKVTKVTKTVKKKAKK